MAILFSPKFEEVNSITYMYIVLVNYESNKESHGESIIHVADEQFRISMLKHAYNYKHYISQSE